MQRRSLKIIKWLFILAVAAVLPSATISWAQGKTALSPAAKGGQKVFEQNCALCHFADQANAKIGPGLKGVLKNKELPYSHKPATVANAREQVEKGNPQGKPMAMPPFGNKLSKTQLDNLLDYLKTL